MTLVMVKVTRYVLKITCTFVYIYFLGSDLKDICTFSLINPFNSEFMKWTLSSLNLDTLIVANKSSGQKSEWQTV